MTYFTDLIERAKNNIVVEIADISPEIAAEILESNPDNRGVSEKSVEKLVSDINAGRWALNGESIVISKDGFLNDGQHRLRAIVVSGNTVKSVITAGVDRATRATVDQGNARTASAVLAMAGVKNYSSAAKVARMVIAFEKGDGNSLGRSGITSTIAIIERIDSDPFITECVEYGFSYDRATLPALTTQIAFWRWLCGGDQRKIDFLNKVATGEMISAEENAFMVRARLAREGSSDKVRTEIFLRGLAAHINGGTLKRVHINGKFPKIEGIN